MAALFWPTFCNQCFYPIPLLHQVVFDEFTEEGRLFHNGIVLGKNTSEHHYRPYILCIIIFNQDMPFGAGVRYLSLSKDTVPE